MMISDFECPGTCFITHRFGEIISLKMPGMTLQIKVINKVKVMGKRGRVVGHRNEFVSSLILDQF